MWKRSLPALNIALTFILVLGISFSVYSIVLALAPNPGHNLTEVGGGAVQGDIIYGSAADTFAALPKNITATRYLSNTGVSNNPAWAQVNLTNGVTGTLPTANGGTGIAFFTAAGPTLARTYTFPDANATVLTSNAAVTVAQGGTGLASLTANNVVLGNGASTPLFVAPGTAGNVLASNGTTWTSVGGWTLLGTATGATVTVGPVIWTGTYSRLMIMYNITGYGGGTPVGRLLIGAASISTTALTNGSTLQDQPSGVFVSAVSAPSIPGFPLAAVTGATGDLRSGVIYIEGASGSFKRIRANGSNLGTIAAPPKIFNGAGVFSDLSTNLPIQRAQLTVYDTLIATAASTNTFLTGTTITVWGSN